jgi:predicted flavoprotein YhiN
MYADDSTMFCASSTCKELTDVLCKELQIVSDWVKENKLVLNITKNKFMVIGTRRRIVRDSCLNLSMGGIPIEQLSK